MPLFCLREKIMAESLADFYIKFKVDGEDAWDNIIEGIKSGAISSQKAIDKLTIAQVELFNSLEKLKEGTEEYKETQEKAYKVSELLDRAKTDEGKEALRVAEIYRKEAIPAQKEATKAAEEHEKELKKLARSAVGFLGQYFAIKKTFSAVMGFAKEGEELARLADLSGMSAQSIERLGIALKNYGGSASSASSTLSKLNKQMEDLKFGKGGKLGEAAVRYGLDVNAQSPEQMLLNIAKRMEGLGATQQVAMGKMLGLDNATLLLVTQGVEGVRKELEKASELQVFSKEDIENSQKLNRAYRELEQRWNQLKSVLNRGLLPVFQVIIERLSKITKYFKENPEQIKTLATVAGVAFGALFVALSPFTALFAAIGAGIALLIDDFVAFKQGGEAALKPVWEWLDVILGTIKGIATAFYDVGQGLGKLAGAAVGKVMDFFGFGGSEPMAIGAQQLAQADAFAGNTMTSSAIANSYASNQTSQSTAYHIGQVTVLQKNNENAGQTTLDWAQSLASGSY